MRFKLFAVFVVLLVGILPTVAQDAPKLNTVSFNGYGFSYADSLISNLNVNITRYAGDPPDAQIPGGPQPANTRFDLYTDQFTPDPTYYLWTDVTVRFYKTADVGYSYTALQTLLKDRLALTSIVSPSGSHGLPLVLPGQGIPALEARPRYIETENVSGISYITYLTLAVDPISQDSYLYTFQGISKDGSTYVTVVARLHTLAVPTADPDYDKFVDGFDAYLAEAAKMLDEATTDQFEPNLDNLDAFVGTITVK